MIVELGKYTSFVLSAYAITLLLLVILIIGVIRFNVRSKRLLKEAEFQKDA